jgi:hypothetical protein
MTMGRVALELMAKAGGGRGGRLRILRRAKLGDGPLPLGGTLRGGPLLLNDPATAREFLALWEAL